MKSFLLIKYKNSFQYLGQKVSFGEIRVDFFLGFLGLVWEVRYAAPHNTIEVEQLINAFHQNSRK